MPAIIRNCGFMYYYPPWEPRVWILYEIAEFRLTSEGEVIKTFDSMTYLYHVQEMLDVGVAATLRTHGYRCTDERDQDYLLSWLEVLVILRQSHLTTNNIRGVMDRLTWQDSAQEYVIRGLDLRLKKYDGSLLIAGERHSFHPFSR